MTQSPISLHDFQSQQPEYQAEQGAILEWLAAAHSQAEITIQQPGTEEGRAALSRKYRKLIFRFGCSTDRVVTRSSALDDFSHSDWDRMKIFQLNQYPSGKPCRERSLFYREYSGLVFDRFYAEETDPPPVLIHVTCTGYVSPSAAQRLVARRDWGEATEVIHAYHMGCYASLPAVRLATGFLERGKPRVDIVHTELCSLHMDPSQHLPEQLVVQTLFADGLIRYSASPIGHGGPNQAGFEWLAAREEIVPDTAGDMSWMISDFGMQMTLSREVPDHIRAALGSFLDRLAAPVELTKEHLCERALFAIHPGNPRIIDEIANHIGLRPEQVQTSNAILGKHGNMSSATLPHVWKSMLEDEAVRSGMLIVSLAFGPGLTISGVILRKIG